MMPGTPMHRGLNLASTSALPGRITSHNQRKDHFREMRKQAATQISGKQIFWAVREHCAELKSLFRWIL
jgi:hypothetical protein